MKLNKRRLMLMFSVCAVALSEPPEVFSAELDNKVDNIEESVDKFKVIQYEGFLESFQNIKSPDELVQLLANSEKILYADIPKELTSDLNTYLVKVAIHNHANTQFENARNIYMYLLDNDFLNEQISPVVTRLNQLALSKETLTSLKADDAEILFTQMSSTFSLEEPVQKDNLEKVKSELQILSDALKKIESEKTQQVQETEEHSDDVDDSLEPTEPTDEQTQIESDKPLEPTDEQELVEPEEPTESTNEQESVESEKAAEEQESVKSEELEESKEPEETSEPAEIIKKTEPKKPSKSSKPDNHDELSISSSHRESLLENAKSSPSATGRWNASKEGYKKYSSDKRFRALINENALKMLRLGTQAHEANNYSNALYYYSEIIDHEAVASELRNKVKIYYKKAKAQTGLTTKEDLLKSATSSPSATGRWNASKEGYNSYPNDETFKQLINENALKMLRLGIQSHEAKSYKNAVYYYSEIVNHKAVVSELKAEVKVYHQQALNNKKLTTKDDLLEKASSSRSASGRWAASKEGHRIYPDDNRFTVLINENALKMLRLGIHAHGAKAFNSASYYYSEIIKHNAVSNELKTEVKVYHQQALNHNKLMTQDDLLDKASSSRSASGRWAASKEGYITYPNNNTFKALIKENAQKMLQLGINAHKSKSFSSATYYYKEVANHKGVSSVVREEAAYYLKQANRHSSLVTKAELLRQASSASGISKRWSASIEGFNAFNSDSRFNSLLKENTEKMFQYANKLEAKAAISYYDKLLKTPSLSTTLKNSIIEKRDDALIRVGSDYAYKQIIESKNDLDAWDLALKALIEHPKDERFPEYVKNQSKHILSEAIKIHKSYNYKEAIKYYNALISGPTNMYEGEAVAEKYKILAMNNLIPNHASYQKSHYFSSMKEALDKQMRRAPQTQSGRRWVNATRSQTEYYLNPDNFLTSIKNDNNAHKVTGKVSASALNVRSGNGTNYGKIDQIYEGQKVTIVSQKNGWYEILYIVSGEKRLGWVSGSFIKKDSQDIIKHDFNEAYNPVGKITATTLNVRKGPGTGYSVMTTVKSGQRYKILKGSNGWYQLDLGNGVLGWVSGDFVTVSNTLQKDLLQFLKLSVSSGIDEATLNQEIGNSGVLTGKGNVFLNASQRYSINEIYLLAHAKLETGNGSSTLARGIRVTEVDGKPVTPKVVYNMFGIGAFDSSPLKSGSEYAYKMGWDTVDKAIMGGAEWISRQYVNHPTHKQDTLYKMRWNPLSPGDHQYATDIGWAYKQTHTLNTLVEVSQKYDLHLNFDVPVYNKK